MQITFINIEDANIIQWITTSSSYYPKLPEGATINAAISMNTYPYQTKAS